MIAFLKRDFRGIEAFGKILKPSLVLSLTKNYTPIERQNTENHSNNRQEPSNSQQPNLNLLTQLRLSDKEELHCTHLTSIPIRFWGYIE